MKLKNQQKIILTVFATGAALFAFACQSSSTSNSGVNTANAARTNGNQTVANAPANEAKPPTMTDYPVGNAQSPSEAYRMLFAAVKSQDSQKIKSMLSKNSLKLAEMWGGQQKKSIDEMVKNGLHETTLAERMPDMRDERTKGDFAAVEVWNEQRKQWDDIPLVKEDGSWKVAYGDQFFNTWQSPGKGQTMIEREAANARNPNLKQIKPAANANVPQVIVPKQVPPPNAPKQ